MTCKIDFKLFWVAIACVSGTVKVKRIRGSDSLLHFKQFGHESRKVKSLYNIHGLLL